MQHEHKKLYLPRAAYGLVTYRVLSPAITNSAPPTPYDNIDTGGYQGTAVGKRKVHEAPTSATFGRCVIVILISFHVWFPPRYPSLRVAQRGTFPEILQKHYPQEGKAKLMKAAWQILSILMGSFR